jgi:leucyl/phenylalanyl-tRNA--protein transferase
LLAAGGDLAPERLLEAYRHGIFPWFSEGEPILWWSPDPRMVFATGEVHVSDKDAALAPALRLDDPRRHDVRRKSCAPARRPAPTQHAAPGLHAGMLDAYERLHELGHAHSIEAFDGDGRLVGGI